MKSLVKVLNWSLVLMLTLALVGCASSKKKDGTGADGVSNVDGSGLQFDLYADSDSGKAGTLKTVNFAYDSDVIAADAEAVLKDNVQFLQKFDKIKVQVEGHCDERGSIQYNLALGERRAKSVKNYLVASGVSAERVSTISYGKEKPIGMGHEEDSWSKNRRANFVVVEK